VNRGDLEREQDIEELRRVALAQQAQIEQLIAALQKKSREVDQLRGKPGDLQLTMKLLATLQAKAQKTQEALDAASKRDRERKSRDVTGPTPQPRLPAVDRKYTLDDADRACPSCGGDLAPMTGQFETSEMIDVVEVRYELVTVKRQKYVCRCGGCVETALGPSRALPGSRYSREFAVKVCLDKWLDHIPLERQVRILERHGLTVTSSTLWELAYATAKQLTAVDAALLTHVKAQPVIGLDQTGWPRLEGDDTKPWQMWCLTAPDAVVHRIRDDKSAATFRDLVGDYHGTIIADALATHAAGARGDPGIVLAACWAHVYRRFDDIKDDHPDAEEALARIGALYEIDRRAGDDAAARAALRGAEAPAILESLRAWLLERAALTHIALGKAAAYALGIWDRLTRFVDDPRVPLDNNATERAIRGPVVGRKNHYGSKSRSGTAVASTMYSILETAKLHDVDPAAYLAAALDAADRGEVLLPWHFAARTPA
jgi:transposase